MISVLIVEDDAFIRDITTIKFSEHPYQVEACASAEAGLIALDTNAFDIILLDLDLPDMSGLELLKTIKVHKHGTQSKVIVFTNSNDDELLRAISEIGVLGLFPKSSTHFEELFTLIDTTLPTKMN